VRVIGRAVCGLGVRFGIEKPRRRTVDKGSKDRHAFDALLGVGWCHSWDGMWLEEDVVDGHGEKDLGADLRFILAAGATVQWSVLLKLH
jgi:hypothetical protein